MILTRDWMGSKCRFQTFVQPSSSPAANLTRRMNGDLFVLETMPFFVTSRAAIGKHVQV